MRASAPLAPHLGLVRAFAASSPLDARSFDARWWPDMPTTVRVRTVPVRLLTNEKPAKPVVKPTATAAPLPPRAHAWSGAALRSHSDIYARHRLRKVVVVRDKAERLTTSPGLNLR